MDVTITNGLEGVRQYFQGLPTTSNPSGNSTPFHSTDQYNTDNIESNIWSTSSTGNGKPSRLPNDEQFPTNAEPNKSIFNNVVNTDSSNSYSLFERHDSSQYKNVTLPKHEMRPHNHEIWKPNTYEQRIPSASSDTSSTSKLNSDETKQNQTAPIENDKKLPGNLTSSSSSSFQDEFQQQMFSSLNKNSEQYSHDGPSKRFDSTTGNGQFSHKEAKNTNNNESSSSSETQSGGDKSLLTRQISIESSSADKRSPSVEMMPTRPSSQSQEVRPASREFTQMAHEMKPPNNHQELRPSSHEMRPPSHEMRPPSHELRPPTQEMRPLSLETRPPSREMRAISQDMRSNLHDVRPPSHEMRTNLHDVRPASHEMRPASHEMRPSSREMRPASHEMRPASHEMRPSSREMRPASHEMRPASHEMRPSSHEMRPTSHEIRPASHEMRPPSQEMRPASQEMRPASREMRLASQEMRPASQEMRPASYEMRPPSHEMRPASQEMRTAAHDMRSQTHEMRPSSYEMKPTSQEMRQPTHEMRPAAHEMRLSSQEMRSSVHEMRPEFRDPNIRLSKDMVSQPQISHEIRSRSLQEIRSLPEDRRLTGMYTSYTEDRLAQDTRMNPELRHLQEQYSQRTHQDLRPTVQKIYDNRSFPSQDIRTSQNIKSFSNEVRLPTTNKDDSKQLSQDYLKPVQLKSSFEARMSNSINQAFNENHYIRPMNNQIQAPPNSSMYSMETKGPNDMQYKMDHEAKKFYTTRPIEQTTRVPPTSLSGNANDQSRINKANLPTSSLNNYHQTSSSEYIKKDPNYMATAKSMAMMNHYNKSMSTSLPPTENRLQQQQTIPRVANNMSDFQKQYLQHTTNSSRQEKLVQRSATGVSGSSSQQTMHFANYPPEQHSSYPSNVLQRHPNVIQYDNSSRQQNIVPSSSSSGASAIKIEQRPEMLYPASTISQQNLAYHHQNSLRQQPQPHDKKLSRSEIETMTKVSTHNSMAYSRSYNNYTGHTTHTTQTTSSSVYNQMVNQYTTTPSTKSINHQEAYERQRLYNNHIQTLQQQKTTQNHHEAPGASGLYSQNYQQHMRSVEAPSINSQRSSIPMQHQQTFQTSQTSSSSTKNPYSIPPRASGPLYSSHSNVQHQLRPEIIVTTAGGGNNAPTQQHYPYSTSSSTDNHLQHYMQQTKGLYYPSSNKNHPTQQYSSGTVSTNSIIERQRHNPVMNANYKNPAYRYPSPGAAGVVVTSSSTNQYHYTNKTYSYVTTNASMSNYTTTSSSMNSAHNSTVLTNSNHHYLQQASIAPTKSSSSQQKISSNQAAPIQMNRQPNYPQTMKTIRPPTIDLTSPSATPKPMNKLNSVSPLDLSVKTVRTSADSTANDDYQIIEQSNEMYNYQRLPKMSAPGCVGGNNGIAAAPKVDFSPNFTTLSTPITTTRTSSSTSSSEILGAQKSYENRTAYYQNYHLQRGGGATNNKIELPPNIRQPQYIPQPQIPHIQPPLNKKRYLEESTDYQPHAKIPRVDNWRLSIDHEIDQRLKSCSKSQSVNQQGYSPLINGHSTLPDQPSATPEHHLINVDPTLAYNQSVGVQNDSRSYHQIPPPGHNTTTVQSNSYPVSGSGSNQGPPPPPAPPPQSVQGADKRVISILRNSLEIKGAKQREEQERNAAKSDVIVQNNIPIPPVVTTSSMETVISSAFVPTTVEAVAAPTKFHIPRAIDSIKSPPTTVPSSEVVPINEPVVEVKPPTTNADLDGLAANLAWRIRTKAELKQVDPAQLAAMLKAKEEETTTLSSDTPKDQQVQPPRRRLFSRTDEDGNTIPHRNSILRSSSEVSVFDFRESDSESEMPILERQSLDDMRRDRKSSTSTIRPPSATPLDPDIVIKQEVPESPDPFFTETCDKFLEQLRTGGSGSKKRGRRKKVVEPEIIAKLENKLIEIEIKVEKCDDIIKCEPIEPCEPEPEIKPVDDAFEPNKVIKQEDSDSDVPLIRKKYTNITTNTKKSDEANSRKSDDEDDDDDEVLSVMKKKEKLGAKIKLESSSESSDNSDNEETSKETVAHRLRQRKGRSSDKKRSDSESSTNIAARANNNESPKEQKNSRSKSAPQKKPNFGDGSDFRPGWEEEVYRYKQSLRMPAQLISIPRPAVRLSTSLPDLDPCPSPTTSSIMDNEFFKYHMKNNLLGAKIKREFADSDLDSNFSFVSQNKTNTVIDDEEEATCSSILSSSNSKTKENNNSIIDVLAQRYGKNNVRKRTSKKFNNNNNRPKMIPKSSNPLELLPTPSLEDTNDMKNDKKKAKNKKPEKPNSNNSLLGFFRKKTVENFRDAFRKNTINEQFTPVIFKSRTRKETQVLKQRATMREVFGEDRPASAPPMTNHVNELPQPAKKASPKPTPPKKKKLVKVTSKSKKENTVPGRAGLRSAIALRGHHHRAVIKNKRNLTKKQLIKVKKLRSDKTKTLSESKKEKILKDQKQFNKTRGSANVNNSSGGISNKNRKLALKSDKSVLKSDKVEDVIIDNKDIVIKTEENDIKIENNPDIKIEERKLTGKKKYKLKSMRRKFSSGFDYIRKKKKPMKKENLEQNGGEPKKPKKRGISQRTNAVTIQDIQREIKGWVLNKGIGETHLHRASRLGYTDVTAYCLETLGNAPSPKDNAGYTPLHEACSRGHLDIAKLLLLYGANENEFAQGGIRPLHEASENGYVEIIRLLLSYGADPLFPTYSGLTPLSLATDSDTISVLQTYIADIQGKDAPPWIFPGPTQSFESEEQGYDALVGAPSPDPSGPNSELDIEVSEAVFPNLYTLRGEDPDDKWVLLQDLSNLLKCKSKDALLRLLNSSSTNNVTSASSASSTNHKNIVKEMKMADFLDQGHCCSLLSAGERVNTRASKISLIKYSDRVKELLGIEDFILSPTR